MRIPAFGELSGRRNILHLVPLERISQHRGVPFLAPVIETLKQIGRYSDAELMAAVVGGRFAVFFEHEMRDDAIGEEEYASELGAGGSQEDFARMINSMSIDDMYRMMADLPEGVKATQLSPSRPNRYFDAFVLSLIPCLVSIITPCLIRGTELSVLMIKISARPSSKPSAG